MQLKAYECICEDYIYSGILSLPSIDSNISSCVSCAKESSDCAADSLYASVCASSSGTGVFNSLRLLLTIDNILSRPDNNVSYLSRLSLMDFSMIY